MTISATSQGLKPGVCTSSNRPANPYDGMMIYETDTKTVLVWNNAAWVCLTPKGATINTNQSSTNTSYVDLATAGPSVTINTGTTALVTVSSVGYNSASAGNTAKIGVAVSGATTLSASDNFCAQTSFWTSNAGVTIASSFVLTGLTAGSNTFKMQYKTDGGTINYFNRYIVVVGLP